MHAYLLLHQGEHTFYRFRGNVNSVNYTFKLRYTDDHVYSNALVHLEHFKNLERGFVKQYPLIKPRYFEGIKEISAFLKDFSTLSKSLRRTVVKQ